MHHVHTHADFRSVGADAPWRQHRPTNDWELIAKLLQAGHGLSPLLRCPCIKLSCFKIDWLHVVDQGIGADYLGNLFKLLLPKMPGTNKEQRVNNLYLEITQYYKDAIMT